MTTRRTSVRHAARVPLVIMLLAGCAGQREPAQKLIGDIDTSLTAASSEAATYVPDRLLDAQRKLGALKAAFDREDYAAVVDGAPAAMSAARDLPSAAAAKKDAVRRALDRQWTGLAAELPEYATAIRDRIDVLTRNNRKQRPAMALDAARSSMSDNSSLWSKSQAAFAAGNLDEAVTIAKTLKTRLESLAVTLQVKLPTPTPTPAPAP